MLVLTRRRNEAVLIDGGRIKVIVVEIRQDRVRLGFAAPDDVSIHREEVQKAIDRTEQQAKEIRDIEERKKEVKKQSLEDTRDVVEKDEDVIDFVNEMTEIRKRAN
jgi:carbon storage regulator